MLLEAFAHRIPAIATPVGGITEVLQDGVSGYVVGVGDTAALAKRMSELVESPKLRHKMGAQGRRIVERQFSFYRRTKTLEALYAEILSDSER